MMRAARGLGLIGFALALAVGVTGARAQNSGCCDVPALAPTAFVGPAAYAPTEYVLGTTTARTVLRPTVALDSVIVEPAPTLVETTYRRGLFGRLRPRGTTVSTVEDVLVPTSYTTAYVPTSWSAPVTVAPTTIVRPAAYWPTRWSYSMPVTTSFVEDLCAVPATASPATTTYPAATTPANGTNGTGSSTSTAPASPPAAGSGGGATSGSSATTTPAGGAGSTTTTPGTTSGAATGGGRAIEPPFDFPDNPTQDRGATTPAASDAGATPAPAPPADEVSPAPAPADGATDRASFRPRPTDLRPQPTSTTLGALRGLVVSGADGKPVADATVVFTDQRQTYADRKKQSLADGSFEVLLPNGDWAVSIADADGKLTPFGVVTVANGRFFDQNDRVVTSIRLNR